MPPKPAMRCITVLLLALACCARQAAARPSLRWFGSHQATAESGRALKVIATSDTQTSDHETHGYSKNTDPVAAGPFATRDLPPWSMMTAKMVTGLTPEQLSVTYWAPGAYLISWVTGDAQEGIGLTPPKADAVQSVVEFGYSKPSGNDTLPNKATGAGYTYDYVFSTIPGFNYPDYASPVLHHTFIKGIDANKTVFYRVGDPRYGWSDIRNFTSLPEGFPFAITTMADSGQTPNTSATVQHALTRNANLVLNVGDLTYADTFTAYGQEACWLRDQFNLWSKQYNLPAIPGPCPPEPVEINEASTVYPPKWDTWARLFEPLFSHVPIMQVNGNHEIELQPDNRTFAAYNTRYPQPQNPGSFQINTAAVPGNVNGSDNNLYSAAVVPGVATIIMLSSFAPNLTFGGPDDHQLPWLKQQLAAVDRNKTPWLIVNFHIPFYTTDPNSYKVADCMRLVYEPVLLEAQVDLIFNGHVHAYERTYPVANYSRNECGIVHIIVGSAGNDEGLSATPNGWIDQVAQNTSWCTADPTTTRKYPDYQPQTCFSFQQDLPGPFHYCPFTMPAWEAYRDASFGSGTLTIHSSTSATWEFFRNQDGEHTVADRVTLTRTPDKCRDAFKGASSSSQTSSQDNTSAGSSNGGGSTGSTQSPPPASSASTPSKDNSASGTDTVDAGSPQAGNSKNTGSTTGSSGSSGSSASSPALTSPPAPDNSPSGSGSSTATPSVGGSSTLSIPSSV